MSLRVYVPPCKYLSMYVPSSEFPSVCRSLRVYDPSCALPLRMHVLSACISSPCVCPLNVYVPSISIFLCLIVSSFVYRLDVYVPPCVRPSFYMSPSCVWPSICMSPLCVCLLHVYVPCLICIYPSVCTSLRVHVPSVYISLLVYVPFVCFSLRVYVPSVCMSLPCVSPLCICPLRMCVSFVCISIFLCIIVVGIRTQTTGWCGRSVEYTGLRLYPRQFDHWGAFSGVRIDLTAAAVGQPSQWMTVAVDDRCSGWPPQWMTVTVDDLTIAIGDRRSW